MFRLIASSFLIIALVVLVIKKCESPQVQSILLVMNYPMPTATEAATTTTPICFSAVVPVTINFPETTTATTQTTTTTKIQANTETPGMTTISETTTTIPAVITTAPEAQKIVVMNHESTTTIWQGAQTIIITEEIWK